MNKNQEILKKLHEQGLIEDRDHDELMDVANKLDIKRPKVIDILKKKLRMIS